MFQMMFVLKLYSKSIHGFNLLFKKWIKIQVDHTFVSNLEHFRKKKHQAFWKSNPVTINGVWGVKILLTFSWWYLFFQEEQWCVY